MDITQSLPPTEHESEGYTLDVNEVAQLLGVTRTRVSQLTTAGVLPHERKKVGIRNRLYYKRSDVLHYQYNFFNRQTNNSLKNHPYSSQANLISGQSSFGMGMPTERPGAFSNKSAEFHSAPLTAQQRQSEFLAAEPPHTGQNISVALNMLKKRLDKHFSQPLNAATWHEKDTKTAQYFESLLKAIEQLDSKICEGHSRQQWTLDELAILKKTLNQLLQKVLVQGNKTQLRNAYEESTAPADALIQTTPKAKKSIKAARYRGTVKKQFSPR